MRRILLSVLVIALVGAGIYGTSSFFSDTETSEGNTFEAGRIDLKIGNESYLIRDGEVTPQENLSWELDDLTNQVFFDFADIKPGDMSEDTIALQVQDNDSYLCLDFQLTSASESGVLEPELADGDTADDGPWDGELDDGLNFVFWADDGDNVLEDDEYEGNFIVLAKASDLLQGENNPGIRFPLADSILNVWKVIGASIQNPEFAGPVTGGETYYIGKAWCFGDIQPLTSPIPQDGFGAGHNNGPLERGAGIGCDGGEVNNLAQSDGVTGVISFYAEQARNNPDFICNPEIEQ